MFWTTAHTLAVISPLLARLASRWTRRPGLDSALSFAGVATSLAVVVHVATAGPVEIAGGAWEVDRVGAVWTTFVLLIAASVRTFAHRQLAADPRRAAFADRSSVLVLASASLCTAADLVTIAAACVATSLATAWCVAIRTDRRPARRILPTLLVGDALLVVAVVVTVVAVGTTSLTGLAELDGAVLGVVAVLVVASALVRCAQPPTSSWLGRTLVAPTPVSAILHAGVVNAGGILLVRTSPAVNRSSIAVGLGLAAATAGVILGLALVRRRADVKGELIWSTVAQMGVMLLQALLGLAAAAALHLVAHGAYKSHRFLTSGSVVEHREPRVLPRLARHRVIAAAATVGVVALAVAVSGYDLASHGGAAVLVPALAAWTVFTVLDGPLGVRGGTHAAARSIGALALTTALYLTAVGRLESWLALPDLTPAGAGPATVAVLTVMLVGHLATGERTGEHVIGRVRRPQLVTAVRRVHAHLLAASRRPLVDQIGARP